MENFLEAANIPDGTVFTKSGRSGAAGHCVEAAKVGDKVAVRHSKSPELGAFLFTPEEWDAFVGGIADGDFRHLSK